MNESIDAKGVDFRGEMRCGIYLDAELRGVVFDVGVWCGDGQKLEKSVAAPVREQPLFFVP
jgi:hypothetical protein